MCQRQNIAPRPELSRLYLGLLMATDVIALGLIPTGLLSFGPALFWVGVLGVFLIGPLLHAIWSGKNRLGRGLLYRIGAPLLLGGALFAIGWLTLPEHAESERVLLAASGILVGFSGGLFADWHRTAREIGESSAHRAGTGNVGLLVMTDVLSVVVIVVGGLLNSRLVMALGILGLWLGGPVVHLASDRLSGMIRSLAFRTMGPLVGTIGGCVTGIFVLPGHDPTENGVFLILMGIGLLVGTVTGISADWLSTRVKNG